MVPYIISNSGNITVIINSKTYNIPTHHSNYEKIKDGLTTTEPDDLLNLIDTGRLITNYTSNVVQVRNGIVYYKNEPLYNNMTQRILELRRDGFPSEYIIMFLENLMENPSNQSINELYDFLSHVGLPITEDGHFLAYKGVRNDYLDIHSGTFNNSPGEVISIKRNAVDDRREQACSHGLHVGTYSYASNYAGGVGNGKVVLVKINPRDAVSVPYNHNCEKLRVSRYEVLEVYEDDKPLSDPTRRTTKQLDMFVFGDEEEEPEDDFDVYDLDEYEDMSYDHDDDDASFVATYADQNEPQNTRYTQNRFVKSKFNVGDRVKVTIGDLEKTGTVCQVIDQAARWSSWPTTEDDVRYRVEFDNDPYFDYTSQMYYPSWRLTKTEEGHEEKQNKTKKPWVKKIWPF